VAGVVLVAMARPDDAGLCRPPDISMIEATDFGNLPDRAPFRSLGGPPVWRILLKREVSASAVMIPEVAGQDPAEVPLVENEHTWSRHSRRTEPMSRSTNGFCHGL
jgi:hypothetical protein